MSADDQDRRTLQLQALTRALISVPEPGKCHYKITGNFVGKPIFYHGTETSLSFTMPNTTAKSKRRRRKNGIHLCSGKIGEYVDQEGTCRRCPNCPHGTHLSERCGYGIRIVSPQVTCVPCPQGTFSDGNSPPAGERHTCRRCDDCTALGRKFISSCYAHQNAFCSSECLPGWEDSEPDRTDPWRPSQCYKRGDPVATATQLPPNTTLSATPKTSRTNDETDVQLFDRKPMMGANTIAATGVHNDSAGPIAIGAVVDNIPNWTQGLLVALCVLSLLGLIFLVILIIFKLRDRQEQREHAEVGERDPKRQGRERGQRPPQVIEMQNLIPRVVGEEDVDDRQNRGHPGAGQNQRPPTVHLASVGPTTYPVDGQHNPFGKLVAADTVRQTQMLFINHANHGEGQVNLHIPINSKQPHYDDLDETRLKQRYKACNLDTFDHDSHNFSDPGGDPDIVKAYCIDTISGARHQMSVAEHMKAGEPGVSIGQHPGLADRAGLPPRVSFAHSAPLDSNGGQSSQLRESAKVVQSDYDACNATRPKQQFQAGHFDTINSSLEDLSDPGGDPALDKAYSIDNISEAGHQMTIAEHMEAGEPGVSKGQHPGPADRAGLPRWIGFAHSAPLVTNGGQSNLLRESAEVVQSDYDAFNAMRPKQRYQAGHFGTIDSDLKDLSDSGVDPTLGEAQSANAISGAGNNQRLTAEYTNTVNCPENSHQAQESGVPMRQDPGPVDGAGLSREVRAHSTLPSYSDSQKRESNQLREPAEAEQSDYAAFNGARPKQWNLSILSGTVNSEQDLSGLGGDTTVVTSGDGDIQRSTGEHKSTVDRPIKNHQAQEPGVSIGQHAGPVDRAGLSQKGSTHSTLPSYSDLQEGESDHSSEPAEAVQSDYAPFKGARPKQRYLSSHSGTGDSEEDPSDIGSGTAVDGPEQSQRFPSEYMGICDSQVNRHQAQEHRVPLPQNPSFAHSTGVCEERSVSAIGLAESTSLWQSDSASDMSAATETDPYPLNRATRNAGVQPVSQHVEEPEGAVGGDPNPADELLSAFHGRHGQPADQLLPVDRRGQQSTNIRNHGNAPVQQEDEDEYIMQETPSTEIQDAKSHVPYTSE